MTPTRFDIYVRGGGRWQRHESLSGDDRDGALARGAALDAEGGNDGIRVMAVTDYEGGRAPLETLAWISPHLSKVASVSRQMRADATAAGRVVAERDPTPAPPKEDAPAPEPKPAPSTKRKTAPDRSPPPATAAPSVGVDTALAGKIALNSGLAVALAAISFVPVTILLRSTSGLFGLGADTQRGFALGIAVLVFAITASTLISRVMRQRQPAPRATEASALPKRTKTAVAKPRRRARRPAPGKKDEVADANDAGAKESNIEQSDPDEASPKNGLTEQMRRHVLEFLANAVAAIKDEVPRLNQHVAFGLNLFGAGAAQRYGEHAALNRMQSFVLVREVVEALGNGPDRVDAFCRQYDEYAAEERYGMMISAGRESMNRHIAGDPEPFEGLADTLDAWTSDAAARARTQGIVCIMFTDIVGSTQMTHERGDYAAQDLVRVHNAIVRTALAQHNGHEVKHTGDGIMASFMSAADAVRAARDIQAELADHNTREDALPVDVRIGLNAGEAVQEEDDFFGTTVQLAARVCDKAGTGEVFVTDNVRVLCEGHPLTFDTAGKYEMKGVPQPMTLYRAQASPPPPG